MFVVAHFVWGCFLGVGHRVGVGVVGDSCVGGCMAIVAADAPRWLGTSFLTLKFQKVFEVALWCCVFWFLVLSYTRCFEVPLCCCVLWCLIFDFFFPMLWGGGGWDCSIATTIDDTSYFSIYCSL